MRFFTTLTSALSVVGLVSALTSPNPPANELEKRQAAGTIATACASVAVNVPNSRASLCANIPSLSVLCASTNIATGLLLNTLGTALSAINANPVIAQICLCANGAVLTQDSFVRLSTQLAANIPTLSVIDAAVAALVPNSNLALLLAPVLGNSVGSQAANCAYPANSTPICSVSGRACAFNCNTGFFNCNGICIVDGSLCSSPIAPGRRRQVSNNLLCEAGRSACALPGFKHGFECLDTKADVESCGGCVFPLPGGQKGVDCTTLPGALDVDCVSGTCVISSCEKGFTLDNEENNCRLSTTVDGLVGEAKKVVGSVFGSTGLGKVVRRGA